MIDSVNVLAARPTFVETYAVRYEPEPFFSSGSPVRRDAIRPDPHYHPTPRWTAFLDRVERACERMGL